MEKLKNLAWQVEVKRMHCICFAPTRPKAQWLATKSYWEAFGRTGWPRPRAVRAPRFDTSSLANQPEQRAWGEDYVEKTL